MGDTSGCSLEDGCSKADRVDGAHDAGRKKIRKRSCSSSNQQCRMTEESHIRSNLSGGKHLSRFKGCDSDRDNDSQDDNQRNKQRDCGGVSGPVPTKNDTHCERNSPTGGSRTSKKRECDVNDKHRKKSRCVATREYERAMSRDRKDVTRVKKSVERSTYYRKHGTNAHRRDSFERSPFDQGRDSFRSKSREGVSPPRLERGSFQRKLKDSCNTAKSELSRNNVHDTTAVEIKKAREMKRVDMENWGRDNASKNSTEKEKPSFLPSGKLLEDTNVYNNVVIKYNEPSDAQKPKERWRLYPFKGEDSLPVLYIHRQSAYLIGRDRKIADLPVDHPSCSKQHAVLQYRLTLKTLSDGATVRRVAPYIIDLGSVNGTRLNGELIEAQRFYELREKDILKFGFSTREFVVLNEKSYRFDRKEENTED